MANLGDADSQYALGIRYENGRGVPFDSHEAVEWYQKAALQGHAKASYRLSGMYFSGRGVTQNQNNAMEWLQKAAHQGDAEAQIRLAINYNFGTGIPKDEGKALEWYQKAADQGDAQAQRNLGYMYADKRGSFRDDVKAVEWFQKAANQGNFGAQESLGVMYAEGRGVPKDECKAVEWLQKAVAGEAYLRTAPYYLGMMYAEGHCVPKDEHKAVELLQKAAGSGSSTDAQYYLGMMYAEGHGVPKDEHKAMELLQAAARLGHSGAQSYLDKKNTLYKNLYRGMPIEEAAISVGPHDRGSISKSPLSPSASDTQEVIDVNNKELFVGKEWDERLYFNGHKLDHVDLMLDKYDKSKINTLESDIISAMRKNNFIPYHIDSGNRTINVQYEKTDDMNSTEFLFLEIETLKDIKADLSNHNSLYDALDNYPPTKRVVEFSCYDIIGTEMRCFVMFKPFEEISREIDGYTRVKNNKSF